MHLGPALACALLGLVVSPPLARLVADPPLWAPSDERGITLEGRRLQVVTAVLTAGLFGLAGLRLDSTWRLVPVLVCFAGLVVVSLVDVTLYRIPDKVLFPTYVLSAGAIVVLQLDFGEAFSLVWIFGCSALAFGFLALPGVLVPGRGMGFGDVKLAALLGLMLGWSGWHSVLPLDSVRLTITGLLVGCVLGVLGGLPLALRRGWRTHFPFGPALALATVGGVLWGWELLGR
jgi:leader peptidase (prepilin peptidase)/N-methyltransferase